MDEDIDALRQEVEELKALTVDTNRTVHKMRRSIWWGRVWTLVWWVGVFAASGAAYYYYAQPLINQLEHYYMNFQHQAGQAQGWELQFQQFLQKLYNAAPGSPSVPQQASSSAQ